MMKKFLSKITTILCALLLGVLTFSLCACNEQPNLNDNEVPEEVEKIVYEGDMLYNGFESIKDMYRVEQYLPWLYTTVSAKFDIVGNDDFIPENEKTAGHVEDDLSPREGDGALRVKYGSSEFGHILARFKNSYLAGLPVDQIGGFSVQIYNNSANKKTVELSLMREQNVFLNLDDAKFTLEPYAWTECKVTLDPIVVDYFVDQLIGLNVRFLDVSDDVYYLDDFRVQFGKVYSEEAKQNLQKVNKLREEIEKLNGKKITGEDLENLETLCASYSELPLAYRYIIENYPYLESAVKECLIALGKEESEAFDTETVVFFNSSLGITQVEAFDGGSVSYITDENKLPNEKGSTLFEFDGSKTWVNATLNLTNTGEYDELHIWIKNTTENRYAFYPSWNLSKQTYDVNGTQIPNIQNGFLITENCGWIHLVYTDQIGYFQFNIATMNGGSPSGSTIGSLYIGKVYLSYHNKQVDQLIEALPEYTQGYSNDNKALVVQAREAFENICLTSQGKVKAQNVDKLITLEANIWKQDNMVDMPASADEVTAYNPELYAKVETTLASYNQLKKAHKAKLTAEKTLLDELKLKLEQVQIAFVNSIMTQIDALDGTDENAIKQVRELYDSLTNDNKALVTNVSKLINFEIDVWISTLTSLPNVNDVTKYDIVLERKLESAREYYNSLEEEYKAVTKVVNANQTVKALEDKLATYGETVAKYGTIVLDAPTWTYVKTNISAERKDFDEARIYIKNNGSTKLVFQSNWNVAPTAYNENGEEISVEYKYIMPKNSDLIGFAFNDNNLNLFGGDGFCFVCFTDSNSATPSTIDIIIERVVFISHAPIVEAQIATLDGSDKNAVIEARKAYNALCNESKQKVSNIQDLLTLEINIWKQENMVGIPTSLDDVTDYDGALYEKVENALVAYAKLEDVHKQSLTEEKTLLDQIIAKLNTYQTTLANNVKQRINALDGSDVEEIKAIRVDYNKLTEQNKTLVDNIDTLIGFEANAWKAMVNAVSTKVNNAKGWNDNIDNEIGDCFAEYNLLVAEAKLLVDGEYAILQTAKTKMATYGVTVLNFDREITPILSVSGANVEYVTDEHAPNQQGAMKVTITGAGADINFTNVDKQFKEIHIWVKNASTINSPFAVNWWGANPVVLDANGCVKPSLVDNVRIPENSGWLKLIYTADTTTLGGGAFNQFNFWQNTAGQVLYIGKISFVNDDTLVGFSTFASAGATTISVDNTECAPNESASLKLVLTATDKIKLSKTYTSGCTKVTIWVKNCSSAINISLYGSEGGSPDKRYTSPKVYDAQGNELSALESGVTLSADSGWVKLEYTVSNAFTLTGIVLAGATNNTVYVGSVAVE